MLSRKLVALAGLCALTLPVAAEDFWVKKPYQRWSAEETSRMLQDSPWAITQILRTSSNPSAIIGNNPTTGPAVLPGLESEGQVDPAISYIIQIRSAAPIREAMVRSSQLRAHYGAMSSDQKTAFDVNAEKFLAASFPESILVTVSFHSNIHNYQGMLQSYWQAQSAAKLNTSVYLNAGADRLRLTGYAFKDDTVQFAFPRPKQLTPEMPFSVEFVHPEIDRLGEQRVRVNFKLKNMLLNDKLVL